MAKPIEAAGYHQALQWARIPAHDPRVGVKLPTTLRGRAVWVATGLWAAFSAVLIVPWLTALAEQAGAFKDPTGQVVRLGMWVVGVLTNPVWAALIFSTLAAATAFAAGAHFDAVARRRVKATAIPSPPQPQLAPVRTHTPAQLVDAWQAAKDQRLAEIKQWSRASSYELYQAASLWSDEPPPKSYLLPLSNLGMANLAMLKAGVVDNEIQSLPTSGIGSLSALSGPSETTRVSRYELQAFAEERGERPTFLFPD